VAPCECVPYALANDEKLQRRSRFRIKGVVYSLVDMLGRCGTLDSVRVEDEAGNEQKIEEELDMEELVRDHGGGTVWQAFLRAWPHHRRQAPMSVTIVRVGQILEKGEKLRMFRYDGSSCCLVFASGSALEFEGNAVLRGHAAGETGCGLDVGKERCWFARCWRELSGGETERFLYVPVPEEVIAEDQTILTSTPTFGSANDRVAPLEPFCTPTRK
jgi:hypothetical protein